MAARDTGIGAPARTVRQDLRRVLRTGAWTLRDLSRELGVRERELPDHLAHLARTLAAHGESLTVEPPRCLGCGFGFEGREGRYKRPGRCPECRGRRISLPRFGIEPASDAGSRGGAKRSRR